MADIGKEAGSFYGEVSSRKRADMVAGVQRMQRGAPPGAHLMEGEKICLEVRRS